MPSLEARIKKLFSTQLTARSRDFVAAGVPRSTVSRMVAAGRLKRIARGSYALPGYEESEHDALLTVARRAPDVVFCLLTALRFHDLTTQSPSEVWIAMANKAHPPRLEYPRVRAVRYSAESLHAGVESHRIDGISIVVTGIAKTIADCFKFRNRIGLDVALEALREARTSSRLDLDELWWPTLCALTWRS
jgi:predicted transcriptional regulator of viral defense system